MDIWEELYEKLDEMIFKHCDEELNIQGQQSCTQERVFPFSMVFKSLYLLLLDFWFCSQYPKD